MEYIVIYAAVAAFFAFRLYAVLGKRTGHEQSLTAVDEPVRPPLGGAQSADGTDRQSRSEDRQPLSDEDALAGLRAIGAADRSFSPDEFIEGAQAAYRMILEAYWSGQLDDVRPFIADDVYEAFAEAHGARVAAGEVLDNRLLSIERATISAASYQRGIAQITVRFEADIASVTRDASGKVTSGSLADAVQSRDEWTFVRDIRSTDPSWILTDTDEAQ